MSIVIGVDVDDTVADLLGSWLARAYKITGEWVLPEELKSWEVSDHFKPEHVDGVRQALDEEDYSTVFPLPGALKGVARLCQLGRVVFVTSCTSRLIMVQQKFEWLMRYGFIDRAEDFVVAKDKSLVSWDFLIDDGAHNIPKTRVLRWGSKKGILLARPHNRNDRDGRFVVNSLDEAADAIERWLKEEV